MGKFFNYRYQKRADFIKSALFLMSSKIIELTSLLKVKLNFVLIQFYFIKFKLDLSIFLIFLIANPQ